MPGTVRATMSLAPGVVPPLQFAVSKKFEVGVSQSVFMSRSFQIGQNIFCRMVLKSQQPKGEKLNVSFWIVALFSKGTNGTRTTRPVLAGTRMSGTLVGIGVRCCWQFG